MAPPTELIKTELVYREAPPLVGLWITILYSIQDLPANST